ncbi:MAG: helix-turn-helix transcriptional regulator, partial [Stackebrandtia sp.]
CGVGDPSILLWHGDLAEALVHIGELTEAADVISGARDAAGRLGRGNVTPRLDRAEAACAVASGDFSVAAELLNRARRGFADYGLRLELGRTILDLAGLERRRRRRAHVRRLLAEAAELFADCHADPWSERVETERRQLNGQVGTPGLPSGLTPAEARIVALVADGASNRQAATALNVSVKTVEGRLTRIYRKLGVETRTQLARFH